MRPDGSQPSSTLNTKISRMPSQKLGMAMPSTATVPGGAVEHAAAIERRHHAERDAEHHAEQQRPRDEHQRVGQAVEEHLHRRLLHADRGAEIAVQRLADEDHELLVERAVEARAP